MAPIRPLAWEPPYAAGAAPEMAKRQKKKNTVIVEVKASTCTFEGKTKFSQQQAIITAFRSSHRGSVVNESD